MRPQPHPGIHSLALVFQQDLALARRYAKMTPHRFTSKCFDKLFHLPSLGVKHFAFNVVLFRDFGDVEGFYEKKITEIALLPRLSTRKTRSDNL